jgi:hypothetical protein
MRIPPWSPTANHPLYYAGFLERCGFRGEVDYVELRIDFPSDEAFSKMAKLAGFCRPTGALTRPCGSGTGARCGPGAANCSLSQRSLRASVRDSAPVERQMDHYVSRYLPLLNPDLTFCVVNEQDEMVGFMITMPNLTRAFQKARGRLFPWLVASLEGPAHVEGDGSVYRRRPKAVPGRRCAVLIGQTLLTNGLRMGSEAETRPTSWRRTMRRGTGSSSSTARPIGDGAFTSKRLAEAFSAPDQRCRQDRYTPKKAAAAPMMNEA